MSIYKCIVVDDNELDRLLASAYVKKIDEFELVGVFENAELAQNFIQKNQVEVAFLDIELPGMSGVELRKIIQKVPACVFISSHFEFAAETFLLEDTIDFIVKPYNFERFKLAVNRILEYFELRTKAQLYEKIIGCDMLTIKSGHEITKVKIHEIIYLEALKNYTLIYTSNNKFSILKGFTETLQEDVFQNFIRIHRSFAVCKERILSKSAREVVLENGIKVPIGRSFKNFITGL